MRARSAQGDRMSFQIKRSGTQFYFRIVASNGKTLANSERYWNKADCRHAVDEIKTQAPTAWIDDQT
jgi:uncharacterized protein YegP (UPF0339 family)